MFGSYRTPTCPRRCPSYEEFSITGTPPASDSARLATLGRSLAAVKRATIELWDEQGDNRLLPPRLARLVAWPHDDDDPTCGWRRFINIAVTGSSPRRSSP